MKEKSVAFFERGSWHHRTKILQEDYTVSYGKKGGFKTREEAEESYKICNEEYIKQLTIHHLNIDKEVFLSDYLIYWFENIFKERDIENTYKLGVAYVIYNLIVPFLKQNDSSRDIKLKLVNSSFFDSLLEELSKTTESAGNKCRECLSLAMQDALRNRYIIYNPINETKQYKRKKPKINILNKSELKKLLEIGKFSNWYLEILLAVFCGLRKGEIIGLKFDDFDLEQGIMRIRRQLVRDPILANNPNAVNVAVEGYILTEKPPKKDSYRIIKVPKIILEELSRRKLELETLKRGQNDFEDLRYISFNRKTGRPHLPTSFNNYLYKTCHKTGIPNISVHGLRHMFATILIERSVPLEKIAALLGHSSPNTTFEIYCDIMDEREKILEFINNKFNQQMMEVDAYGRIIKTS